MKQLLVKSWFYNKIEEEAKSKRIWIETTTRFADGTACVLDIKGEKYCGFELIEVLGETEKAIKVAVGVFEGWKYSYITWVPKSVICNDASEGKLMAF